MLLALSGALEADRRPTGARGIRWRAHVEFISWRTGAIANPLPTFAFGMRAVTSVGAAVDWNS